MNPKLKYKTFQEFEKDEYLRVMTFYEGLEDIMDNELFSDYNPEKKNSRDEDSEVVKELKF